MWSSVVDEAVEQIGAATAQPLAVLTCEHASNRLPEPWFWPEADRRLVEMHWAYDLGIAEVTRRLAAATGSPAVLSRFSRLLIDPNRPVDSDTLLRGIADGQPVALNQGVTAADRAERIARYYEPYHAACDALVGGFSGLPVVSLHSFTPSYEGQPREVQLGVLYDDDDAWGEAWYAFLSGRGYDVRRNEPWSGKQGLMYGPQRHARRYGRRAVELEVRQDLATDPAEVDRLTVLLAEAVRALA